MESWLKWLVAIASAIVVTTGSIWIYDRYQSHVSFQTEQAALLAEAKLEQCESIVKSTWAGSESVDDALNCADTYPSLAWFKITHQDAVASFQANRETQLRAEKAKADYFARESMAKSDPDKACFAGVRTMYEFGGPDAFSTLRINDPKIVEVRNCIDRGIFTEQEVQLIIK